MDFLNRIRGRASGPREFAQPVWVAFIIFLGRYALIGLAIAGMLLATWQWPVQSMIAGGGLVMLAIMASFVGMFEAHPTERQLEVLSWACLITSCLGMVLIALGATAHAIS